MKMKVLPDLRGGMAMAFAAPFLGWACVVSIELTIRDYWRAGDLGDDGAGWVRKNKERARTRRLARLRL